MSTKMTKLVLAIGAMVMAGGAMADGSANIAATATVLAPLAVTAGQGLDFGSFALKSQTAVGSVLIGIASDSADYSNTIVTSVGSNATKRGTVTLSGQGNATFSIGVSASATVADATATPNTMTVDTVTFKANGGSDAAGVGGTPGTGTLTTGLGTIYFGGKLNLAVGQVPGVYSSSNTGGAPLIVTVAYN